MDDFRIGEHFRMSEFLVSSTFPEIARRMEPTPAQIANATRWVALIGDPSREVLGRQIINSGIRTLELHNAMADYRDEAGNQVYHPSKTSQHFYGEAADSWNADLWGLFHFMLNRTPVWQLGIYLKANGEPKHVHSAPKPLGRKLAKKVWIDEDGVFKLYKL